MRNHYVRVSSWKYDFMLAGLLRYANDWAPPKSDCYL